MIASSLVTVADSRPDHVNTAAFVVSFFSLFVVLFLSLSLSLFLSIFLAFLLSPTLSLLICTCISQQQPQQPQYQQHHPQQHPPPQHPPPQHPPQQHPPQQHPPQQHPPQHIHQQQQRHPQQQQPPPNLPNELKIELISRPSNCQRLSKKSDLLTIHYNGKLAATNVEFDNSRNHPEPFKFQLGAAAVIRGWEEGLQNMCVGEIRKLTVPPHMGYGDRVIGELIFLFRNTNTRRALEYFQLFISDK
ncbi:FKBP14 [Acanthosepion pharaonis]|uniref:peptidylprolyl isomerase n=1 Tax=Acanthosepion pharaonis TaxID=158019 RepID=A0A812D4Y4_ACAPH|nr:FKBP14 [Sepia pharaonis]